MTDESLSRRRLLATASAAGVGTAGCLGIGGPSGPPDYVCTALDDEPTERVPSDGSPIPFAFERPSVMEQSEVQTVDGGGRVEYSRTWTQTHPGRERDIDNALRLRLRYLSAGAPRGPMLGELRRQVSVVGKRSRNGEIVGVFEREDSGRQSSLSVQFPVTDSGEQVYDQFAIEADAILGGPEEAVDRAKGDDPDQTCRDALQAVTTDTLDSVTELSPVETETELSLSPASASVRRGDEVELAVEASGVDWVDLTDTGGNVSHDTNSANWTVARGNGSISLNTNSNKVTSEKYQTNSTHDREGDLIVIEADGTSTRDAESDASYNVTYKLTNTNNYPQGETDSTTFDTT